MTQRTYGWRPDKPDQRDFQFKVTRHAVSKLPSKLTLRPFMPPVYDQGQLGSCTANASGAAMEFLAIMAKKDYMPSRLFIYYNERAIEGTIGEDAGAEIRDGIKALNKKGVCDETAWPYDIDQFTIKPTPTAFKAALKHKISRYERVDPSSITNIRAAIGSGCPVIFGFTVYESFESAKVAKTGIVTMPRKAEKAIGGHAVLIVGYDHPNRRVIVRNSWGADWGQGGYFTMPYAYVTNPNLSDDFWLIRG